MESLKDTKPGDIILLHGCCHNPTGANLNNEQWKELQKFSPYINKYIILHDTTIDGEHGEAIRYNMNIKEISEKTGINEEGLTVGLWPAVEEFIKDNPEWKIKKRYENNNGLTILTK